MKRILLTGGGTAGHIMPLIAVWQRLKKQRSEISPQFLVIGANLKNLPIQYKNILAGKWRRGWHPLDLLRNFFDLFKVPLGLLQAFWHIFWFMPDVCFAKGGYASLPAALICRLFFVPVVIHESDTIPGASNRFLAKITQRVCISFEVARKFFPEQKVVFTGNPVRREILEERRPLIDFQNDKPTVLVIGGSQGAQRINELIQQVLPQILRKANVIHQTGRGKKINFNAPGYQQFEFIEEMSRAYHQASVIVSRAGANALAEIAALKKPSILIPYPYASYNHQVENAYIFADAAGAIVLEEEQLGPNLLLENIFELLDEPMKAQKMGENAHDVNPADAAESIAEVIDTQ